MAGSHQENLAQDGLYLLREAQKGSSALVLLETTQTGYPQKDTPNIGWYTEMWMGSQKRGTLSVLCLA